MKAAASSETASSCASSVWDSRVIGALLVRLSLGTEALAFDDDGIDVMQDAIEDRGGQGAVIVEDLRPVLVGAVGGDHHRSSFVALADDLEQQVGAMLVDGKISELVDDQQVGLEIAADLTLQPAGGLGCGQGVDDVDGGGEENGVAADAGGVTKSQGDMGFAEANIADEDDVGVGSDKGQTE